MSIRNILNGPEKVVNGLKASAYLWHDIYGSKDIREYYDAREVKAWVYMDMDEVPRLWWDDANSSRYGTGALGYNDSFNQFIDAVEFTDKTILLCCVINSWGGTFASHDDATVKYFYLAPKTATQKRKWK